MVITSQGLFDRIASATPPRMKMLAMTRRDVSVSDRSATAPIAAMIGTVSCTVAACVVVRAGRARYQIA